MNQYKEINTYNRQEWEIFEEFKNIDLRNHGVILKNCENVNRIKFCYPFYNEDNGNIIYEKMENYGDEFFEFNREKIPYCRTWKNNREAIFERAVEVSLGNWFLNKFFNVVEVGAVMPYFLDETKHEICDPYDLWPNCNKIDGELYDYTNKNVLSISSIEHFGVDNGYDNNGDKEKAGRSLDKIIKQAQNYLITWPIGQNIYLDDHLKKSNHKYVFMTRKNRRDLINNWYQNTDKNNFDIPYLFWDFGAGYYGGPNSIVIVSNLINI